MQAYIGPHKKNRTYNIEFHPYDLWNLDSTLASIIHPALVKFRMDLRGSPFVDMEDVPEELHPPKDYDESTGNVDESHVARWHWVLGEMIFAFGEIAQDNDWEEQFWTGAANFKFEKTEEKYPGEDELLYELKKGPNHTLKVDDKAREEHFSRMKNGFRLFGKYIMALWD